MGHTLLSIVIVVKMKSLLATLLTLRLVLMLLARTLKKLTIQPLPKKKLIKKGIAVLKLNNEQINRTKINYNSGFEFQQF